MAIISIYWCRACQDTFRPRKGKNGRTLCKECAGKDNKKEKKNV